MGADWYTFTSITVAAIPVPIETLKQPFDLQGFKLLTVQLELYDNKREDVINECHGAMICLADTELLPISVMAIGPYEIEVYTAVCKRMKHLDAFMPAAIRDSLATAFETYTGCKPDVVPGFWTVSATTDYVMDLHATWSLEAQNSIVGGDCRYFSFSVRQDDDDSNA